MRFLADWFIHGEVDWEWWNEHGRKWSPVLAGAAFGAAWWVWADALVFEKAAGGASPPFKFWWPGIIAALALVLINLVSRDDLAEAADSGEEGADARARLWLLFSVLLAFAAIAGSVAVLVTCSQAQQFTGVGVASVAQCALILASALVFWAFRSDQGGGGYSYF